MLFLNWTMYLFMKILQHCFKVCFHEWPRNAWYISVVLLMVMFLSFSSFLCINIVVNTSIIVTSLTIITLVSRRNYFKNQISRLCIDIFLNMSKSSSYVCIFLGVEVQPQMLLFRCNEVLMSSTEIPTKWSAVCCRLCFSFSKSMMQTPACAGPRCSSSKTRATIVQHDPTNIRM